MHIENKEGPTNWYPNHKRDILQVLRDGATINQAQALMWFGCMRLASRIYDLRQDGWAITTTMVEGGQRKVAEYQMELKHLA